MRQVKVNKLPCDSCGEVESHWSGCVKGNSEPLSESARLNIAMQALSYYADPKTYIEVIVGCEMIAPIEFDKGAVARNAIERMYRKGL